ncbi:carboxypeptidase-like regulatory domain-containing protein [Neotamlana laminarinivorans]|uniref:Carboxypeptidase-like regulatory domain-containing protein n=1 Tax=Neotamlana laminarinivorans TaxID=2883124 RepID=A0A9X1I2Q8_9FLAO|nr:carboxypeptidase-like regulatory domain-containing protein [Tamlana laminarinivorans]MCB4799157.1 carboxypeptidase-like regulatory domain-containing protein [Tamlana laminarinivorans]
MKQAYLIILLFSLSITSVVAQHSINARLIDSTTQKPIPFANITLGKKLGVISNDEGIFQIHFKNTPSEKDSLEVSSLGYETKRISALTFNDSILVLQPSSIELDEVLVSNKQYTAEEIIEKVHENLEQNYSAPFNKSRLFYRVSYFNRMLKKHVDVKKTTIPELNQKFADSILNILPNKNADYTEILGDFYIAKSDIIDDAKLDIIKASHLYDKNNEVSFEGVEERLNTILQKRVKRDSYFKVKSGLFGTKTDIDTTIFNNEPTKEEKQTEEFLQAQKKKEEARKKQFLSYRKSDLIDLQESSFIFEDSDLNFIYKPNKYEFEIVDHLFLNEAFVYKITFKPRRGANYKGVLYVNTDDFAVVRADYQNVKQLKSFNLLGISYEKNLLKGVFIYEQDDAKNYKLKYAESVDGTDFGIKRPFKIIEKNKHTRGRRKQNEISTDIHFIMSNSEKRELVVFEAKNLTQSEFNNFKENPDVKPTYLPDYDPTFWEGYNVIEPNEAIKSFKSID